MTIGRPAWTLCILCIFAFGLFSPFQQVLWCASVSPIIASIPPKETAVQWQLPQSGPPGLKAQSIVYIADDLRNGGVLGVGVGVREAAARMGWQLHILDIGGRESNRAHIFQRVLELSPDAIVLGGVDVQKNLQYIKEIHATSIPLVGWHSAAGFNPTGQVLVRWDVATEPKAVAQLAARYVIEQAQGKAGVVLFTDSRFGIARKKSEIMAETIGKCGGCSLLEIVDLSLEKVGAEMPRIVERLMRQYGARWQYTLAINDLYFDHAASTLAMLGRGPQDPPFNISAGDGSASAFFRIRKNIYQKATVAEPLLFQGWQIIDELNRILQGLPPSGFRAPPALITREIVEQQENELDLFEPKNGYRKNYLRIWHRGGGR